MAPPWDFQAGVELKFSDLKAISPSCEFMQGIQSGPIAILLDFAFRNGKAHPFRDK
jgi:hypothetical protein